MPGVLAHHKDGWILSISSSVASLSASHIRSSLSGFAPQGLHLVVLLEEEEFRTGGVAVPWCRAREHAEQWTAAAIG